MKRWTDRTDERRTSNFRDQLDELPARRQAGSCVEAKLALQQAVVKFFDSRNERMVVDGAGDGAVG